MPELYPRQRASVLWAEDLTWSPRCRCSLRHQGRLSTAVEHYVTKIIQQKLFSVMNQLPVNEFGPRVLIACPEGEAHEIGAQAVAYIAAIRGYHVYYLGPNLPSSDLATFCE